jgi:hypothetical protein
MEELLQKQKGGTNASNIISRRTKKIFSYGGYDFFSPAHSKHPDCQPYSGRIIFVNL